MTSPNTTFEGEARFLRRAVRGEKRLGPLRELPGTWRNTESGAGESRRNPFFGRGWNMIALPFEDGGNARFGYRMLVNRYNEELSFNDLDGEVPNRGTNQVLDLDTDQTIFAIDYQQSITQLNADDSPKSTVAGKPGLPIHHEPGFMLHIENRTTTIQAGELNIARLASIPHGNSVLAMGVVKETKGAPRVPTFNGLPTGVGGAPGQNPYLAPYDAFSGSTPFLGIFDVVDPNKTLTDSLSTFDIKKTTELIYDTKFATGNIVNIPFIERQADASEMRSIFYIMDIKPVDLPNGKKVKKILAYTQLVFLDFFPRPDGVPGLIRWPHVSINVMYLDA